MFRNYKYSGSTAYLTNGYFTTNDANSGGLNLVTFNRIDWNGNLGNSTSYDALIDYLLSGETVTMTISGGAVNTSYIVNSFNKNLSLSV
jgi:hypothetical protein